MPDFTLNSDPDVENIFKNYPDFVRDKMYTLRKTVIEVAKEAEEITHLKETLRWGEPSFISKYGSTIRIDWKPKVPDQYAMYFQCTSRLIPTFKMVLNDVFEFEGKRAIIFQLNKEIPVEALKLCIKAALMYHKVKYLPTLGI